MRPNVVLIVLDAARADHFEPYGAPVGSTPVVAELARRGSVVPRAYANGSWTVPSHTALFTGLLPRAAGLSRAPAGTPSSCRAPLEALRERLLAEVFARAGYETRGLSTNAWLLPGSGFDTGFERFELIDPTRDSRFASAGRLNGARARWEALRARVDDGAGRVHARIEAWLAERRDRPFFWFVNLVEAHSPYLPHRKFNDLGALDRIRAAGEARRYLTLDSIWRASLGQLEVPAEALERMWRLYAGAIRALDAWIGELAASLDRAGVLDETLLIITADHGENLGENGMLGHAFSLDERLLRVPLIMTGPSQPALASVTSLASLPSRLGESLGIPGHPWDDPMPAGIAVAQFDPPSAEDDPRNRLMLDRWGIADRNGALTRRFTSALTSATDGRQKVVSRGDEVEVFDLERDPLERNGRLVTTPVGSEHARLYEALVEAQSRANTPDPPAPTASPSDEVEDLEQRMRTLGYL